MSIGNLKRRGSKALVVWRHDRLGRSLPDLAHIVAELEVRGVGFESLTVSNSIVNFPVLVKISTLEKLRKPHEIWLEVSTIEKNTLSHGKNCTLIDTLVHIRIKPAAHSHRKSVD